MRFRDSFDWRGSNLTAQGRKPAGNLRELRFMALIKNLSLW